MLFPSQACLIWVTSLGVNPAGGDSWVWLCAEEDPLGDAPLLACCVACGVACGVALDGGAGDEDEDRDGDGFIGEGVGHMWWFLTTQACCVVDILADFPSLRVSLYRSYQARIFPSSLSMLACKASGGACPPTDERAVCLVRAIFAVCVGLGVWEGCKEEGTPFK